MTSNSVRIYDFHALDPALALLEEWGFKTKSTGSDQRNGKTVSHADLTLPEGWTVKPNDFDPKMSTNIV